MEYDKPFKDYDDLIDLMVSRNLIVEDRSAAKKCLRDYGYYGLINGYKGVFIDNNDQFEHGTTMEMLVHFRQFDKDLQNILFKYSVFIETKLKNTIAYAISKEYGVDERIYLRSENYSESNRNRRLKEKTLSEIRKTLTSGYFPTKYYVENHNHVPAWILLKNVSWNTCENLYGILKPRMKRCVTEELLELSVAKNVQNQLCGSALFYVRKFRNAIAHDERFVTLRIVDLGRSNYQIQYRWFNGAFRKHLLDGSKQNGDGVFAFVISLCTFLNAKQIAKLSDDIEHVLDNITNDDESFLSNKIWRKYCSCSGIPIDLTLRLRRYLDAI
ncbi:MAG: Abi family protein [Peptoniphilaceae bacterium]|nr:Abi family protein [Peptoniphilaceae bacterium]MDY6085854.1 Abi family protein [Peptoniphilaceae bacterium]